MSSIAIDALMPDLTDLYAWQNQWGRKCRERKIANQMTSEFLRYCPYPVCLLGYEHTGDEARHRQLNPRGIKARHQNRLNLPMRRMGDVRSRNDYMSLLEECIQLREAGDTWMTDT